MDRGIKIAIIVACALSLGLGLIWDSVIDTARSVVVKPDGAVSSMSPDSMSLRVGDMTQAPPFDPAALRSSGPQATPDPDDIGTTASRDTIQETSVDQNMPAEIREFVTGNLYKVQHNDSWWKIAHHPTRFKFLGKSTDEWKAANTDISGDNLKVGTRIRIPE